MNSPHWETPLLVALGIAAVILIAFVSLAESALLSTTASTAQRLVEERRRGARALARLVGKDQDYLSVLITTFDVCLVVASFCATRLTLNRAPAALPWVTACAVAVILLFGEVTPKTLGSRVPERMAPWVARPVELITRTLSPLVVVLTGVSNAISRLLGVQPVHKRHFITEDDIVDFAGMGERAGALEETEKDMIEGIIQAAETTVAEVRVPRTEMQCMKADASPGEAVRIVQETGHSRLPVYGENLDDIKGVLYAKDLMIALAQGQATTTVGELVRPALFVPETKSAADLFRELRREKVHIAIVVDEYGGIDGLVTIEDVLEEIVGELHDEHDVRITQVVPAGPNTWSVDGRVELDVLEEALGLKVPEGDYTSLGGFLMDLTGEVPEVGDRIAFADWTFVIEAMAAQRVARVIATRGAASEPEAGSREPHAAS